MKLNPLVFLLFFFLPLSTSAQSWTCCRTAAASKNVCDGLARFRTEVLAAVPATDTVCNLAIEKLCRSRLLDDSLSRILTLLRTYPMLDRILFLNDIHGINNLSGRVVMDSTRFLSLFVSNLTPAVVNAWRICRTRPLGTGVTFIANMRFDWDVLQSVARDTANRILKNVLFIRNLDRYDKLLSNYRGSCNACASDSTVSRIPRLSKYLDSVAAFAMRYGVPPNKRVGFDSFMTQEGSARGIDKPDGAFHLMRDLASPTFTDVVVSFESRISEKMPATTPAFQCARCKYDVELAGNILVDYKSVNSPSVDTMQFKQYIQYWQPNPNPTNPPLRSFKYVFNGAKIADTATIRQRFYTTFKNNPTGYFLINPDFFTRFFFNVGGVSTRVSAGNVAAFINAIDKTHVMFNFVTIKP